MKKISLATISEILRKVIESEDFLETSRRKKTAFTRKMPFCDIIYFMCGSLRRTLQRELKVFFKSNGEEIVSRQAFSKSRELINPEALQLLSNLVVETFEKEDGEIETYRGYRLFAVDGSSIDLPNTPAIREHFGFSSNGSDKVYAKGLAITAFDVLNKLTIFSELYRYDDSEKRRIFDIINVFKGLPYYDKSIFLLDRGYPSFELFEKLESNKQNFLIRVSSQNLKKINECNEEDELLCITRKNVSIKIRVVNITLDTGETEKLVTNLPADFSVSELKELYAKRWGVETNFNYMKNKELLECFTGESVTAVLQDFYAGVLILNVAAIAYREQEDILEKNAKGTKHTYKPNKTQLIADIKTNWVKIILAKSRFSKVFRELFLYRRIKKYAYAEIPNRHVPRAIDKNSTKHKIHTKSPF